MRLFLSFFLLFAFSSLLFSSELRVDTGFVPSIRYTKAQLKKEIKDLKLIEKQLKEWNKAIKQKNIDYLNVVFSKTIDLLSKEHNELSNRISIRSKELYPPAQTTPNSQTPAPGFEDKPQVYNSELRDQYKHVNKEDLLRKKAESDYLNNYIQIIRNEKAIINKLNNTGTFNGTTPDASFEEISKDFKEFVKEMNEEIHLMKRETGKK